MSKVSYRVVPNSWRSSVEKPDRRRKREPQKPIAVDLLSGKTVFVTVDSPEVERMHKQRPFATWLYSCAVRHGKRLRVHRFDDVDKEEYGWLMWMEKAS